MVAEDLEWLTMPELNCLTAELDNMLSINAALAAAGGYDASDAAATLEDGQRRINKEMEARQNANVL